MHEAEIALIGPDGVRLVFFALIAAGCGGESADQAVAQRQKELNLPKKELVSFSGTVTIDGQPPEIPDGHALLVALSGPNDPPPDKQPPRYVIVQKDGKFEFKEGGVSPGSYVVAIALLRRGRPGIFAGPMPFTTSTTIRKRTRASRASQLT